MLEINEFEYNNEDEPEMAQLHSIHLNLNAIAKVRANIANTPSLENCIDCGDDIPLARQYAVMGCIRCITCQAIFERKQK